MFESFSPSLNPRIEKITKTDPRWIESVEYSREVEYRYVYGLRELDWFSLREASVGEGDEVEAVKTREWIDRDLRQMAADMKQLYVSGKPNGSNLFLNERQMNKDGVHLFLSRNADQPNVMKWLEKNFPHSIIHLDEDRYLDTDFIAKHLDDLPPELFRQMLDSNVSSWRKQQDLLQEKLPEFRKIFSDKIKEKIRAGRIPLDPEKIESDVEGVPVFAGDPALYSPLSDRGGDYNTRSHSAVISIVDFMAEKSNEDNVSEYIFRIYSHELLHALSGQTIATSDLAAVSASWRLGLSIGHRFNWLNEAITEKLNIEIVDSDEGVYMAERQLFDTLLLKSGIADQDFVDVYFENLDPSKKGDDRIPAYKKLIRQINEKFGAGFLNRLDDYVAVHGVEATIDEFFIGK